MAHTVDEYDDGADWRAGEPETPPTIEELQAEIKQLKNKLAGAEEKIEMLWGVIDAAREKIQVVLSIKFLLRSWPTALGGHVEPNMHNALTDAIKAIEVTEKKFDRVTF